MMAWLLSTGSGSIWTGIYMEIIFPAYSSSDFSISYLTFGRLIPNFCVSEIEQMQGLIRFGRIRIFPESFGKNSSISISATPAPL